MGICRLISAIALFLLVSSSCGCSGPFVKWGGTQKAIVEPVCAESYEDGSMMCFKVFGLDVIAEWREVTVVLEGGESIVCTMAAVAVDWPVVGEDWWIWAVDGSDERCESELERDALSLEKEEETN